MRILAAIDAPACSAAITHVLIEQVKRDAELRLLHVVDPLPAALAEADGSKERPDFVRARREQREEANGLLEGAATELRQAGFRVTTAVTEGDPATCIPEVAES